MPAEKNKVFIDTDAFVALADKDDPHYHFACELNLLLENGDYSAYTSNFTFGETVTVISQNTSHTLAVAFGEKLLQSEIMIIDANRKQEILAMKIFAAAKSKNVRFTDFVNMVLMKELDIATIFSFDRHYKLAGFTLLTPQTVL